MGTLQAHGARLGGEQPGKKLSLCFFSAYMGASGPHVHHQTSLDLKCNSLALRPVCASAQRQLWVARGLCT